MNSSSEGATFGDMIVAALERCADRDAFVMGDRHVGYAEARVVVRRFLRAFQQRGLVRGGKVAALSPNSPECWLAQAAAYLSGASFTGLQLLGGFDEHCFVIEDSGATILIVDATLADQADLLKKEVACLEHVIVIDGDGTCDAWDDSDVADLPPLRSVATGDDIAWLQYTGGTTGRPKGVEQTHSGMAHQTLVSMACWDIPPHPVYLAATPITHGALLPLFPMLASGGTVVLLRRFAPEDWFEAVERNRVTWAFGIPTMIYALLDAKLSREYDTSSLYTFAYGASPMSPTRLAEALGRFGQVLIQLYGQTENCATATVLAREDHDPERPHLLLSCGRATTGSLVGIFNEDGSAAQVGEIGELCVRSRSVMRGYRNLPAESREALCDGWLHSGDLARLDEDGYFYIVDRKKDMIISGGLNIYAREVEDVLMAHPAVAQAAAIGIPHPKWGEAVKAVVVLRAGDSIDVEEIASFVRERKGSMYAPKAVEVVPALPMTTVGKVDKKALRLTDWQGVTRAVN